MAISARPEETFQVEPVDLRTLRRLLSDCQRRSIDVSLVTAVILPECRLKVTNMDDWLASLSAELDHPIVNAVYWVVDQKKFSDLVHLNRAGQKSYSAFLKNVPGG